MSVHQRQAAPRATGAENENGNGSSHFVRPNCERRLEHVRDYGLRRDFADRCVLVNRKGWAMIKDEDLFAGAQVRARRKELGMTQEELAGALGLTFQQVQKYERGINRISVSRLAQIMQVLSVPAEYFFDVKIERVERRLNRNDRRKKDRRNSDRRAQ